MRLRKEVERGRIVAAGRQHQRPRLGGRSEGATQRDLVGRLSLPGAALQMGGTAPGQRGKPGIEAHGETGPQIACAQELRDKLRHIGGLPRLRDCHALALGLLLEQRQPCLAGGAGLLRHHVIRWVVQPLLHGKAAFSIVLGGLERLADARQHVLACLGAGRLHGVCARSRCCFAHSVWNVGPSGAGKSRCWVQLPAHGKRRNTPRRPPKSRSSRITIPLVRR